MGVSGTGVARAAASTAGCAILVAAAAVGGAGAAAGDQTVAAQCGPGARTLSHYGDHVYPETGNGGYRSVHTDVRLIYDATANQFLPGSHVNLHEVATQCLTQFTLDLERTSAAGAAGPDLTVHAVTVAGRAASFRFVQPTYPGDPNGADDPDPRAHEASQNARVGGPTHNPLPPACSPELVSNNPDAQDGQQCPANKLVITPSSVLRSGQPFEVTVSYTGRPGL